MNLYLILWIKLVNFQKKIGIEITNEVFDVIFPKNSPINRPKFEGFKRNKSNLSNEF